MANRYVTALFVFCSFAVLAEGMTFREAKPVLFKNIFVDHPQTLYCGCAYSMVGNKPVPDLQSCGYQVRKQPVRASRIEVEHVVPASWFGKQRQCWQHGGRKNCTQNDAEFARIEGDLHNLWPAIGEVNGDRSDYRFGLLAAHATSDYGMCDFHVDNKARVAQPREAIRGDIARIHLYMQSRWNVRLSDTQLRLMEAWSKMDPVDDWECERDARIASVQGNHNPYVASECASRVAPRRGVHR